MGERAEQRRSGWTAGRTGSHGCGRRAAWKTARGCGAIDPRRRHPAGNRQGATVFRTVSRTEAFDPQVRAKRIVQRLQVGRWPAGPAWVPRGTTNGRDWSRPLGIDRPAVAEEDEEIGPAVVVHVGDRPHALVGETVERLDEINPPIEVAIRFPANERALIVVLEDIRSAVKIGVERNLGEPAPSIVGAPDVRPSVAVPILFFF